MKKIRPTQKEIDEIMEQFNFEKVHKVMTFLDWTWARCNGVPNLDTIRGHARHLLEQAITGPCHAHGSGGFVAMRDKEGTLYLSFDLESWDATPDEAYWKCSA